MTAQPAPIRPQALLKHARALAEHRSGAGRPQLTWLRRSTSAAYYAHFHSISLAVIDQVAALLPSEHRHRLARSIAHGRVAEICRWVKADSAAGKEHVRPIVASLQSNADVTSLADIFLTLQQARHEADYDHLAVFKKATVLSHVAQAEAGVDLVASLKGHQMGERFFALVALNVQLQ